MFCKDALKHGHFNTEAMDEDQESEAEDEEDTEAEEEVEALEEEEGTERQDHWRKWMKKLDDHLHELPLRDVVVDQAEDEEELLPADDTSSESESSHEFGVIIEDGDEDSDEDQEEFEEHEELITEAERGKKVKPMNKGLRSKLGHHKEELQKAFLVAKKQGAEKELRREEEVSEDWSKKSRKFSVLELFTWTCMISIVAGEQGWTAYEPITLPRWDIKDSAQREEALLYLDRVQPGVEYLAGHQLSNSSRSRSTWAKETARTSPTWLCQRGSEETKKERRSSSGGESSNFESLEGAGHTRSF